MPASIVSTQEVASLLNVTETTIKRWADESLLPCIRTPGGHRKFRLKDVVRFAESRGYTMAGVRPPAMTSEQLERLEVGVHTLNYRLIAEVFREEALQADRQGILTLLLYLYKHHIPFPVIMDEVVRPAFEVVGTLWENGTLEVNQEHAASQATLEALIQMSADLHRKSSNGKTAVCACIDGELHELGVRGVAYSLQCEGWNVHFLGANTPMGTLASFVKSVRPQLVCVSLTSGARRRDMRDKLAQLATQIHMHGGMLVIGGNQGGKLDDSTFKFDHAASSIRDAIRFTREVFNLKPGPRPSRQSGKNSPGHELSSQTTRRKQS